MSFAAPVLALAILLEVAATASLPRTHGFTVPAWTVVVVAGYALSAWMLAIVVKYFDVSVVYAIWSGAGTAAIALVGVVLLGEPMDWVKGLALAMIIAGVVVLNLHGAH